MSGFAPDAYIVGAAKSGTTTLAALLGMHPAICVAQPKEPDWFTRNRGRGESWYRGCFRHARGNSLLVDASTSYGAAPHDAPQGGIAAAICARRPDARIVLIVRDPVARAWSSYWHGVRAGEERRGFAEAISDPVSVHLRGGLHAARLGEFRACFPAESILVLDMRDLVRDPGAVARRAAFFIGVDPGMLGTADAAAVHRNSSFRWKLPGRLLHAALGAPAVRLLNRLARLVLPAPAYARAKRMVASGVPEIGAAEAALACALFAADAERMAREFGVETRTGPWWRA